MFGYDKVGRKIYVAFGDNVVCAVEKLNIKPETINIKKPTRGFQKANMVIADVYRRNENGTKMGCENEFAEQMVGQPVCEFAVSTLEDVFCEKEFWITEEETDNR